MDCPDSCALDVEVRDGTIDRIRAAAVDSTHHPNTQGFICGKVSRFGQRVYHESRILHPLRRTGPKGEAQFERISWDDALALIAERFQSVIARYGAEAILPYHYDGSNGLISHEFLDAYLFAKLGTSRLKRTLCAAPATAVAQGLYGRMPGVAFEDYPHARAILVWGANPKFSNIHLVPYLQKAKRNGAFVAMLDPIRHFSAAEVDLHLPLYPGTDLPVALGMIHRWHQQDRLDREFLQRNADGLEPLLAAAGEWSVARAAAEARVPAADLERLADVFAAATPAVIRAGWGIERNQNGGQALSAILAMPALLGKFGVRGGGYTLSNSGAARLDLAQVFGPDSPPLRWKTRALNMSQLGHLLTAHLPGSPSQTRLSPPIQALFVYDCNPVATAPDQNAILHGLAREDLFTVVHEQVMTDTARFADLVLPAVTFLEQHEIKRSYGSYIIGGVQPAIEPVGEAKPNEWLFAQLGRTLGFQDEPFSWDTATCLRKITEALDLSGKPLNSDAIRDGGAHPLRFADGPSPIQFRNVKPRTPDARIHLTPAVLGPEPYRYHSVSNPRFPLALVSNSNNAMISSTLGEFNYPELRLTLHPKDAASRGIAHGDTVRVHNDLGEVQCRADVSDRLREGVCSMPKGAWQKSSRNARTSTALCPQHVNIVGGGACYNDARVEVERVSA